jgi:uncharacterized protein (TIGR01777 family)
MKILVTGSSGLVGAELAPVLEAAGDRLVRLVRSHPKGKDEVLWDPQAGTVDTAAIEVLGGVEAVVHLAGKSIAGSRWTPEEKQQFRDSRGKATRALAEALVRLSRPPRVLVSASAVGYYGDRGDEILTEETGPGTDFLADLCREWEAATLPAAEAGIRVVTLRIGVVLSRKGGALAKMLPPFKLGLGGPFGSGKQWMSWVAIEDLVGTIRHALGAEALHGPVNAVAPHPVTNAEFARTLGQAVSRPAFMAAPAFALRLLLGEGADAMLLFSQRVEPRRLLETGYAFRYPELAGALRRMLG